VAFGVVGMLQHLIVAGLTLSSPQLLPASHVVSILVYVIAIPFFSLYAICVALTIAGTGQSNVAWLMGVGFGVLCRVIAEPWLALVAAFATVVVGHWGVQRSLASYPWPKELLFSRGSPPQGARSKQQPDMGWPYVQLGPDREGRANFLRILSRGRISTGLLIGWWIYAILSHFEYVWAFEGTEEVHSNLWHSCNGLIAVLAAGRLFIYCVSHWPPISFLGRVATGHWIIPGYDQVLVAPVISVAASLCLEILLRSYGVTTQYAMPIVLVSAWSLISSIGPSFETWHFTGSHRLMRW
jgi:hypothetical protein